MRIYQVATPDNLSDSVREKLDYLDSKTFEGEPPYKKDGCYWWLVYDDKGEAVGFAGLKVLDGLNKGLAFLCRAGVLPKASGHKLQRRLIRARIRKARKLGVKEVITYTSMWNFKSAVNILKSGLRFYKPENLWAGHVLYFNLPL